MNKKSLSVIYLVLALGAVMLVQSCKKDDVDSHRIYATIQQYNGDKMHITNVGQYPYSIWDVGDKIQLHSWSGTVGLDEQTNSYYIEFANNIVQLYTGTSYANELRGAVYPLELWQEAATDPSTFNVDGGGGTYAVNGFHFGPTQLYEAASPNGPQKLMAPMVAVMNPASDYSLPNTDNTLEFKNICALLKVTVNTSTPIVVTRIEVENSSMETDANGRQKGRPLWGNFEITFDNNLLPILREQSNATIDYATDFITKEVTLECEHHGDQGGVSVSSSHPFYIYLPPVGYKNLRITVYAKQNAGTANEIEKCITLASVVEGTFAANTIYPLSVTFDNNNWIDVPHAHTLGPYTVDANGKKVDFSFSNLHSDGDGYFFPPYQYDFIGYHDPNNDHDHFTKTQRDAIIGANGYASTNGYSLLSVDEWNYLLNTRGGETAKRFAHALVATVPGIILFPDGYTPPSNIIAEASINHTENDYTYTDNILSISQFYVLENAGCVFLPCVNYSTGDASTISDVGYYWTSETNAIAYSLAVGNITSTNLGNYGSPAYIRLVRVRTANK